MSTIRRKGLLVAALLTLAAAIFAPPPESGVELAPRQRAGGGSGVTGPTVRSASSAQDVAVLSIDPRNHDGGDATAGIFLRTRWSPPAQRDSLLSDAVPDVSPAPTTLTPPFRYLGRYIADGQVVLFLQYNDQNLVVRVGDTIDAQYKVESLDGGKLSLRYLPLDLEQTLDLGG